MNLFSLFTFLIVSVFGRFRERSCLSNAESRLRGGWRGLRQDPRLTGSQESEETSIATHIPLPTPKSISITHFITNSTGIGGKVKCRHRDFQVFEIRSDGSIVPLIKKREELKRCRDKPRLPDGLDSENRSVGVCKEGCWIVSLSKYGLSTFETIERLSTKLGINEDDIGYNGLKDAYAMTTQDLSLPLSKVSKEAISRVKIRRTRIGHLRWSRYPCKLGSHAGNRFSIHIRNTSGCWSADGKRQIWLNQTIQNWKRKGFINYYGEQRFTCVGGVEAGRCYIMRNYTLAAEAILRPFIQLGIKESLETQQPGKIISWILAAILAGLTPSLALTDSKGARTFQRRVFESLMGVVQKGDYRSSLGEKETIENLCRQAILGLPFRLRLMVVSSYQSKVWNSAASERIRMYGIEPTTGDTYITGEGVSHMDNATDLRFIDSNSQSHRPSIFKIVLPLPGKGMVVPRNEMGGYIRRILEEDGTWDKWRLEGKGGRQYLRTVRYRFLLSRVKDVEYSTSAEDYGNGSRVKIAFNLRTGEYATMALRELTKR